MISSKFEAEYHAINTVLEKDEILEINLVHETETSMEISVVVTPDEYIQAYVRPLAKIGYSFYSDDSTILKLCFQKGDSFQYRLYLTQAN